MIRLLTVTAALVLFFVPTFTAATQPVIVGGAVGLLLTGVGILAPWRWPITAAACVFLTDYAAALWIAGPSIGIVGAAGVGVALLLLLHSVELARCTRHATLDARVVRSQVVGWIGFAGAALVAATLLVVVARVVAAAVPFVGAPILAAAGALGVVLALATALGSVSYPRSAGRRDRTRR